MKGNDYIWQPIKFNLLKCLRKDDTLVKTSLILRWPILGCLLQVQICLHRPLKMFYSQGCYRLWNGQGKNLSKLGKRQGIALWIRELVILKRSFKKCWGKLDCLFQSMKCSSWEIRDRRWTLKWIQFAPNFLIINMYTFFCWMNILCLYFVFSLFILFPIVLYCIYPHFHT